jgi:prophage tail gpP-like protein
VQGWTDAAGQLWHPNGMVHVDDDWLALHDTLLISGVKFMLSADSGTTTELTVTKQEAFALAPITAGTDYDPRPDTHIFPPSTGKGGQL